MTNQEAFDGVWNHLITLKSPKSMVGTHCKYRGNLGAKCAIGALLPDNLWTPGIEGYKIKRLVDIVPEIKEFFGPVEISLLDQLQLAHDMNNLIEGRIASLTDIATEFNLKIPGGVK